MQNETAEQLTLDALHDDCLECIFCRITDLKTQIQISRVCRRFRDIYARLWRRNIAYHCLCFEDWREEYDLSSTDFAYFVNILRDVIREIKLISYNLPDFLKEVQDTLNIESFPNVQCFKTENFMDLFASSVDIFVLATLLPNVKVLKLTQALTGRHLKEFQQLQELHLYHDYEKDYELKNQYLHEICESLPQLRVLDIRSYEMSNLDLCNIDKCQELEVLKLNLNVLKPVLIKVLALPKLKTLTVLLDNVIDVSRIINVDTYDYKIYETQEFYYILQHMSDRITGIAVDNYYMPLKPNWDDNLEIFKHNILRKFAYSNYEYSDEMLEKYTSMKELRLLCCRNWPQLSNETLLKIVEGCTKLEHLDITYCSRIDVTFVEDVFDTLKRMQPKRKHILSIYYYMSGIDSIDKVDIKKYCALFLFTAVFLVFFIASCLC